MTQCKVNIQDDMTRCIANKSQIRVPDQPMDDRRWGVYGSATVGPGTSFLPSV